ncbi:MAG: hypothetical protein HEP71_11055 [Roseivirga sp.]|nr:hypothetical protein [Roseivirga sp.]
MTDPENLKWQFDELLKTLIIMSLPFELQRNAYDEGATADEMLEDFHSYYTLKKNRYREGKLIDERSILVLDKIERLTDTWSQEKEQEFWFEMDQYENEWNVLREMAKGAMITLKKEHLNIEVKHDNELNEKGDIVVQRTHTILKAR